MTSITTLSAMLIVGLTSVLAPGKSATFDEHKVLYTGHPDMQQARLELIATRRDAEIVQNGARVATLNITASRFEPGVCVDDAGVTLAFAGEGEDGFELVIWSERGGVSRVSLAEQAVSAERAAKRDAACSFALLDAAGTLHLISPAVHEHAIATGFVPEVIAREELTVGLPLEHTPEWVIASDTVGKLAILEFSDLAVRAVELDAPAVGRMLLNGRGAWVLSSAGSLWWVPRSQEEEEPLVVARSNARSNSGLTVWRAAREEEPVMAWVSLDGVVHLYDGAHERLQISRASVRWPLLVADVLERGEPQLIALGDDGVMTVLEKRGDFIGWHREDIGLRPLAPSKLSPGFGGEPSRLLISSGSLATYARSLTHTGAIPIHRSMLSWWESGAAPLVHAEGSGGGKESPGGEDDLSSSPPGDSSPEEVMQDPQPGAGVGCQTIANDRDPRSLVRWFALVLALLVFRRARSDRGVVRQSA